MSFAPPIERAHLESGPLLTALGGHRDELSQTLAILAVAGVERPESLTLAVGDRILLAIQHRVTGRAAEVVVTCGSCGAQNKAAITPESVPEARPRTAVLGTGGGLREATYADLRDLPLVGALAAAELLRRCVVGEPALPPTDADFDLVDESLSGPLVLRCVECSATVEAAVDVQQLALEMLQREAAHVDLEVHLLARSYHWDLSQIVALPDERRRRLARLVSEQV